MRISSHKDLNVWQKGMDLVTDCYQLTERFPDRERYGLSSQIRRAAVSVPSNIAEGHARKSTGAYLNHLAIARGSLGELETQIEIGVRLGYVGNDEASPVLKRLIEVRRMVEGLSKSLQRPNPES